MQRSSVAGIVKKLPKAPSIDRSRYRKSDQVKHDRGKKKSLQRVLRRWRGVRIQRTGKGGEQTMERDDKPGSVRGTGVARQSLLPAETTMCALCSGQEGLRRSDGGRDHRGGEAFLQTNSLVTCAYDFHTGIANS